VSTRGRSAYTGIGRSPSRSARAKIARRRASRQQVDRDMLGVALAIGSLRWLGLGPPGCLRTLTGCLICKPTQRICDICDLPITHMLYFETQMPRPELYPVKKVIGFDQATIDAIDKWRAKQKPLLNASEAIRRLLELGLATTMPAKRTSKKSAAKAAGLAAETVDHLVDPTASPEDRAQRKRRLLKGPSEFREMREDHPKAKG
jgi:hypothetical protein